MDFDEENEKLIEHLKETRYLKSKQIEEALRKFPRYLFIPERMRDTAGIDAPLSIGYNQTISQPSTVVIMTEALNVKKNQKIMEIGTGSGCQAAILSHVVGNKGFVYSIEIVKELAEYAKKNIESLKIKNIEIIVKDGSTGLPEKAPFDRIIVTAASPDIPKPLINQLKIGGIMVIPIGNLFLQEMYVVKKTERGIRKKSIGNFVFVPLKGKYGFK
ncbi:protein-L-isoaspartate O-methyltransferase [Candidatus Micrarchaeota archaeon RBG_16_36_9]|nr:MAG: protein-L-isoaspartate O-methyltransferase [Candidatus Micrarchaeota archaeon RBG_16_36_9]